MHSEHRQLHHEPSGTFLHSHPDPEGQAYAEHMFEVAEKQVEDFQNFVDTSPNVNNEYSEELATATEEFARMGLSIAPTTILEPENFIKALEIAGQPPDSTGYHQFGRNIICNRQNLNEEAVMKRDEMLNIVLHEAAHSTAEQPRLIVVSRIMADTALLATCYFDDTYRQTNAFIKNRFSKMSTESCGTYLEEAFADLTRVKILTRLGREVRADDGNIAVDSFGLRYIGRNLEPEASSYEQDLITIPMRFASSCVPNKEGILELNCYDSGMAGYGLELLDEMIPGLYETMVESRTNPSRQRDFIGMINGVQRGLYQDLRALPYTAEGFKQGLLRIMEVR